MNHLLTEFAHLEVGGVSQFEHSAKLVANYIKKRSMIILFSDFLGDPQEIEKTLKHFVHKGSELIIFHVLTEEELNFPFEKFSFFKDLETGEKVKLHPGEIKKTFQKEVAELTKELKLKCTQYQIDYVDVDIQEGVEFVLQKYLIKRSKII